MARVNRMWQVNVESGGASKLNSAAAAEALPLRAHCDETVAAAATATPSMGATAATRTAVRTLLPLVRPPRPAAGAASSATVSARPPPRTGTLPPTANEIATMPTGSALPAVDAAACRGPPSGVLAPVQTLRIGVLALQGAFAEHVDCLKRLAPRLLQEERIGLEVRLVRTAREMRGEHVNGQVTETAGMAAAGGSASALHGLVLPGGESTTMRRLLRDDASGDSGTHGADLLAELRRWVHADRPTFGTCAGCILLADRVLQSDEENEDADKGAVALDSVAADDARAALAAATPLVVHADPTDSVVRIGGVAMTVTRNYYGRQLASFSTSDIQLHDADLIAAGEDGTDAARPTGPATRDRGTIDRSNEAANSATRDHAAIAAASSLPAAIHRGSGVFIRAPAMLALGPRVRVLASLPHAEAHRRSVAHARVEGGAAAFQHDQQKRQVTIPSTSVAASTSATVIVDGAAVGVRSGNLLATTFHPELPVDANSPVDLRWHRYFVRVAAAAAVERW